MRHNKACSGSGAGQGAEEMSLAEREAIKGHSAAEGLRAARNPPGCLWGRGPRGLGGAALVPPCCATPAAPRGGPAEVPPGVPEGACGAPREPEHVAAAPPSRPGRGRPRGDDPERPGPDGADRGHLPALGAAGPGALRPPGARRGPPPPPAILCPTASSRRRRCRTSLAAIPARERGPPPPAARPVPRAPAPAAAPAHAHGRDHWRAGGTARPSAASLGRPRSSPPVSCPPASTADPPARPESCVPPASPTDSAGGRSTAPADVGPLASLPAPLAPRPHPTQARASRLSLPPPHFAVPGHDPGRPRGRSCPSRALPWPRLPSPAPAPCPPPRGPAVPPPPFPFDVGARLATALPAPGAPLPPGPPRASACPHPARGMGGKSKQR